MRAAQNNPGQNQARPVYPNANAPFMPPQSGVPQPTQSAAQNTSVYRSGAAASQPGVKEETKTYPSVRQATQAYQPARQDTKAYQPQMATQAFSHPANQPDLSGMSAEDREALAQDTQSLHPAPVDPNFQRLNLQIKTAKLEMEELPAQNADESDLTGRKRIRRTERNKNLYNDSDRNA